MMLGAVSVFWPQQGGGCMYQQIASAHRQEMLGLVWVQLSAELRIRVVALLAQLALHIVIAGSSQEGPEQEARDAKQTTNAQDPA